jgi:hypothetical protein
VEGEEPPSEDEDEEDDGSGQYVDEEEVENTIVNGTLSAAAMTGGGQKTVVPIPWGRKQIGHQPDDEDDELMMYATKVCLFVSSFLPLAVLCCALLLR